jgi:hypothetical protein
VELFLGLSARLGTRYPPDGIKIRPPNCEAALIHPEIVLRLVVDASPDMQSWIFGYPANAISLAGEAGVEGATSQDLSLNNQKVSCPGTPAREPYPEVIFMGQPLDPQEQPADRLQVVDSHMHLDMLACRAQASSWAEIANSMDLTANGTISLVGAVANFAYPAHWHRTRVLPGDNTFKVTYGIHPRLLKTDRDIPRLVGQLVSQIKRIECAGLGEIGIDLSQGSKQYEAVQRRFFEEIVEYINPSNHVLVIHCRDEGNGRAAETVLRILIAKGLQSLRIHRHCFMGGSGGA